MRILRKLWQKAICWGEFLASVPFTNIRETTKDGVLRFVSILSGLGAAKRGFATVGIWCRSDIVDTVSVEVEENHPTLYYLPSPGLSSPEAQQKLESKAIWYDIGVGNFENPGFQWVWLELDKLYIICYYIQSSVLSVALSKCARI